MLIDPPNASAAEFLRQITWISRHYGFKIVGPFDLETVNPRDDNDREYRDNHAGQWEYQ